MFRRLYSSSAALVRTPLFESHKKYGAKFVPYVGFEMPILYLGQSHVDAHNWVRTKVGLFDVSHMLQHRIEGPSAGAFLQKVAPIDTSALQVNSGGLSVLLNKDGGIIDDTIITKHADDKFYMVTNAGCRAKDVAFLKEELKAFDDVKHETFEGTLLAVQGPLAAEVMQQYTSSDLTTLLFGQTRFIKIKGIDADVHISRTGYTGEDGFELSIPSDTEAGAQQARAFFEQLIDSQPDVVQPIGLAPRDSLRLEAGMCLYGNELNESITPPEASLAWLVPKLRRSTGGFNGSDRILSQLNGENPTLVRRIGVVSKGPAARTGSKVFDAEGNEVGEITSGSLSPTLSLNVAQAYIDKKVKIGSPVEVEVRRKRWPGIVTKLPFVPGKFYRG